MDYEYENKTEPPNLATCDEEGILVSGIHYDVENSDMTDKSIEYCTWWERDAKLLVVFTNELSAGDKTLLDQIVEANT